MQDVQQRKLLESPQIYFYGMCPTLMVIEKQGISQLKSSTFDHNFCYFPSVRCLPSRFSLTDPGLQNESRTNTKFVKCSKITVLLNYFLSPFFHTPPVGNACKLGLRKLFRSFCHLLKNSHLNGPKSRSI